MLIAHLIIAVEDTDGTPSDIPVALLDWLPDHLTKILTIAEGDEIGLLNLLNEQTDDNSLVIRDWLVRNDDNQRTFSQWIFKHRQQVK